MEILNALGEIFDATEMVPVTSVQIAGVSYANLGEPGLDWLAQIWLDPDVQEAIDPEAWLRLYQSLSGL